MEFNESETNFKDNSEKQEQLSNELETEVNSLSIEEIESNITKANEIKLKANRQFASAEYDKALEGYREAVELLPKDCNERAFVLGNMAACYLKQEKYTEAAEKCTEALNQSPDYTKALLRRAQANERIGTWTSMNSALDDYNAILAKDPNVSEAKIAVERLPPRIAVQQEKEKDEMMGKLKNLGNTILGKFGLSTNNFQMTPSEGGGYSLNFKQ